MEATFVVNPTEIDPLVLEQIIGLFADKKEPVTIHITETQKPDFDFQEWFQGMEEIRKQIGEITIPTKMDINDIIDDSNDIAL